MRIFGHRWRVKVELLTPCWQAISLAVTAAQRCALLVMLVWCGLPSISLAATKIALSPDESAWISAHKNKTWTVGFDPLSGVDSFEFRGQSQGILPALLADMQKELGLQFAQASVNDWDDAYQKFVSGKIDVLYGANPTVEREKIMRFTAAALKHPYILLSRKNSTVQTLGDLDGKQVGFLRNDYVQGALPDAFPNIRYATVEVDDQDQGLKALNSGFIDGFVTTGGGVEYEYLHKYPALQLTATLQRITSDMTFAVAKDQPMLASLMDRYLAQRQARVAEITQSAIRTYNRKALRFTAAELNWLESQGEATVGVAEDYLPFDHHHSGNYRGIMGATLQRIADLVGIRFHVFSAPFAEVMDSARAGRVDLVNMAKTEERLKDFVFPHPVSTERDIIVGLKTSPPVQDVYGLDGQRVAVIEGFWHEEYLRKNLKSPQIVLTTDIKESLRLLRKGDVAYMIENPTVVEYYINGLGYTDVVTRGKTSKDSFIYFGVTQRQPELASILDKVIPLISFDEMKFIGIQSVPALRNETNTKLATALAALTLVVLASLWVAFRYVRKHAEQRAQTRFLKEREHLLYTDALTGFHNRNYFSRLATSSLDAGLPQMVIVADLNNLKHVNDTHGHAAGDAYLTSFAQAVRDHWPAATCFRVGGDEFVIILNNTPADQGNAEIASFHLRCNDPLYAQHTPEALQPNAALGCAWRTTAAQSIETCMAEADRKMYEAKRQMKKRATDVV